MTGMQRMNLVQMSVAHGPCKNAETANVAFGYCVNFSHIIVIKTVKRISKKIIIIIIHGF